MRNDQMISLVKQYQNDHHHFNQITFYSDIGEELLSQVNETFPEFDRNSEIPLLFYIDANEYYKMPRWFMLSDSRLYFSMYYYPYHFRVIDVIPLNKINNFEIITHKWPRDSYVKLNNRKYYSIRINEKWERKMLSEFINSVLGLAERNEIEEIEPQEKSTDNLENAALFSIAEEFFKEENRGGRAWGFECFYYGPFIPVDKLEKAREDYAKYDDQKERAIIYVDNSWVGRIIGHIGSSGFIITNKYLYYKLDKSYKDKKFSIGKIALADIKTFNIKSKFSGWMIINSGKKYRFMLTQFTWWDTRDSRALERFMQKLIQELNQ